MTPRKLIVSAVFIVITYTATACGGGSEGTGSRSLEGSFRRANTGEALSGVIIALEGTSETAQTDSMGKFHFESSKLQQDITLVIDTPGPDSRVTISNVPEEFEVIRVDLSYLANNTVQIDHLEVDGDNSSGVQSDQWNSNNRQNDSDEPTPPENSSVSELGSTDEEPSGDTPPDRDFETNPADGESFPTEDDSPQSGPPDSGTNLDSSSFEKVLT